MIEGYVCPECNATVDSKTTDTCDYCVMKFYTGDPYCYLTIASHKSVQNNGGK